MAQLTYPLTRSVAVAGMLADGWNGQDITSFPALEVIEAGRAVEVVVASGGVRLPASTGDVLPLLAGVAVYKDTSPPGGYQIGDMVPVLRKGRVWAQFSGTGATELEDARVYHSSTIATNRGKFTDAAADATATTEVSTNVAKFRGKSNSATLALVDLNLPL